IVIATTHDLPAIPCDNATKHARFPHPRFFFLLCYRAHRDLHSFPTRRSSDLEQELGPTLAGLTTLEMLARLRGAVDEVCQIFREDRKSTRLNSSHVAISYAVFCLKKKRNGRGATFARRWRRDPGRIDPGRAES